MIGSPRLTAGSLSLRSVVCLQISWGTDEFTIGPLYSGESRGRSNVRRGIFSSLSEIDENYDDWSRYRRSVGLCRHALDTSTGFVSR
jgi:hypothetical protein